MASFTLPRSHARRRNLDCILGDPLYASFIRCREQRSCSRLVGLATPAARSKLLAPTAASTDRNSVASKEALEQVSSDAKHAANETITTIFRWPAALGGKNISVVGSFNGWKTPLDLRRGSEEKDCIRSIALPPGQYQYRYKVDGAWATSPCEAIVTDAKGRSNNQRLVAGSAYFQWLSKWGGEEVFVTGDFTSWTELIPLNQEGDAFSLKCSLPLGVYSYQYLVNGSWMTSPDMPVAPDDKGHLCNRISVGAPPAFRLLYATGWEDPILHAREIDSSGTALTEWQEVAMARSASRARPEGGFWYTATLPALGLSLAKKQEFYISNIKLQEETDRPLSGKCYTCPVVGGYRLASGFLTPYSRACQAPTMLVSDLDGTMVGESEAADAATQQFCDYWENEAAVVGSVLVYNTGRSLGQFIALLEDKAGKLALPDVLITAVGTKIFLLGQQAEGRGKASSDSWREDQQWATVLDFGWDLAKVKQVAEGLLSRLAEAGAGHWLDQGTEHPHRIALSIQANRIPSALEQLREGFAKQEIQVQVIVSGVGSWRYVDCVSIKGGKLKALEYVRTLFGIPKDRCIAAGDSGNDILMLAGENKAIVVGNAQPELVDWLLQQPQDDRLIYTSAHLAQGVLEGIARHGLY